MEQRQCDAAGQGTDASRMLEQWTRGKRASPSESARAFLRNRVLFCSSWKATSYASIFGEKDFIRAEKLCYKFYEQFVIMNLGGHCDSEDYFEIGTSLAFLPIFRGKECMAQEREIETMPTPMSPEYKKALQLQPKLPGENEGYTSIYKTMQELMRPLDANWECKAYLKDEIRWDETRHSLRRVPLLSSHPHPSRSCTRRARPSCSRSCPGT